jgi:hypothetical protein
VAAFATSLSDLAELCCGRLDGTSVGNRDGVGGSCCPVRFLEAAVAAAFAAPVFLVVASLGILLGGLVGEDAPPPVLRMFAAPAVDLVTLTGRCSDVVAPLGGLFNIGREILKAGSTSSSSSSESTAALFVFGVFLGCPGGVIRLAFAAAAATCLLGVTGKIGVIEVGVVFVVCITSSSVSAGGVAGVTSVVEAIAAAA